MFMYMCAVYVAIYYCVRYWKTLANFFVDMLWFALNIRISLILAPCLIYFICLRSQCILLCPIFRGRKINVTVAYKFYISNQTGNYHVIFIVHSIFSEFPHHMIHTLCLPYKAEPVSLLPVIKTNRILLSMGIIISDIIIWVL